MSETESSSDASMGVQAHTPETDMRVEHDVVGADAHPVVAEADPVPVEAPAPVPVASADREPEGVAVKEVIQMVGAMVFVFCFAALGFNAMYHAGY